MKKVISIVLTVVILLIFIFSGIYVYIKIESYRYENPSNIYKITRKIGWWPYQEYLTVNKLAARLLDSNTNLFNNKSQIEISLTLKIAGKNKFRPRIS